jgi:hypothetical protein
MNIEPLNANKNSLRAIKSTNTGIGQEYANKKKKKKNKEIIKDKQ